MHVYYITGFFFLKHENVHSQKINFCEPKPFLVGNSAQLQADFLSLAGLLPPKVTGHWQIFHILPPVFTKI